MYIQFHDKGLVVNGYRLQAWHQLCQCHILFKKDLKTFLFNKDVNF